MLPSSGYFSHLVCPYHEKGNCQRVYCHFKHKKIEQTVSYTPTPVHLLQKQPKPVQPSGSVYKPTPIDKLKQTVVQAKPEPANSDNGNAKPKATKSKSGPEDDCVFKKIESKLSSIFESNDETTTDEDEIVIIKEEKPAKSATEAYKDGAKKDAGSYIEELDKITKETKAKRDLSDKEIVEKVKLKQKANAPVIGESDQEVNPAPKKARIAHKIGDVVSPSYSQDSAKKVTRLTPSQVMLGRFSGATKEETKIESSSKKRIAHVPLAKTAGSTSGGKPVPKRPMPLDGGTKVPNTIRQKYLNLIIDECLKANPEHEEAYERALTEEQKIYKRSPSKNSYINLAAIAIKRIRDSIKANS